MSATASTRFPMLNEWKQVSQKNTVLDFVDNVLSGFAQIALNDNSFSGIILMIAAFVGSPIQAVSGIWATIIGTLTAHILGVSKDLIRTGLYGFNPALCGLALPVLVFPEKGLGPEILIYSTLAAIFATVLTVGLSGFLSRWSVPSLALPYCITLLLFVPAAVGLGNMNVTRSAPAVYEMVANGSSGWMLGEYVTATLNSIGQVLWIDSPITGILYLVAVIIASRIDLISTIIAAIVSVWVSVALGLPKEVVISGVYGFNAILLMKAMTRGFLVNAKSYLVSIILSILTVVFSVSLRVIFAPIGAIASFAFPFALLSIAMFLGRDMLKGMTYIPNVNWGVPETIKEDYKAEKITTP